MSVPLCRGGGGIPRPDPPLNKEYSHKRVLSAFENNLWFTCGSQPVYVFSNPEQFQQDHLRYLGHVRRQMGGLMEGAVVWGGGVGGRRGY